MAERQGNSEHLTTGKAARRLHRSERSVRMLLKQGTLKGVNPTGRKWLIPRAEVARFLGEMPERQLKPEVLPSVRSDPELGPHGRELFYFGQRFRDLVSVPPLHEVRTMTMEEYKGAMWDGWPAGDWVQPPRDAEEEAVAREWGSGCRDARTHSLFRGFQQHLLGYECWESLNRAEIAYNDYGEAWRRADEAVIDVVSKRTRGTSSNAAEGYADAIARSLLANGLYRKRTGRNLVEPRKEQEADGWLLHLGSQFCRFNSPTEADALAKTYKELRESLLPSAELSAIAKAQEQVEKAIANFRASLPESLLRKLVLNGRCEWCP